MVWLQSYQEPSVFFGLKVNAIMKFLHREISTSIGKNVLLKFSFQVFGFIL